MMSVNSTTALLGQGTQASNLIPKKWSLEPSTLPDKDRDFNQKCIIHKTQPQGAVKSLWQDKYAYMQLNSEAHDKVLVKSTLLTWR